MDEIDCIQIEILELKTKLAKLEEILKIKLNELDVKRAPASATIAHASTTSVSNEETNYSYYI
jgi:hypothetical protein